MKKYTRHFALILAALMLLAVLPFSVSAVSGASAYKIVGLRRNLAVQKAVIWGNYIYVIQHASDSKKTGDLSDKDDVCAKDSYLTRCKISGTTATAEGAPMILKNFGHAQSLEVFTYNNKTYLWVNCKANPNDSTWHWGIQCARIEFQAGRRISYTSVPRITFGNIDRLEFALSSNGNRILFWTKNGSTYKYSYYNTAAINKKLDAKAKESSKYINVSSFSCLKATASCASHRPNNSNQGLEFTDAESIYICGGATGVQPKISKLTKSGTGYKVSKTISTQSFGSNAEIEGLQLKGDYVYFGITYHNRTQANGRFMIYKIAKTAFN